MVIYLIRNKINGRCYIGKSSRSTQFRWRQHKTEARIGRLKKPLYDDMRKFGFDAFEIVTLAEVDSQTRLNRLEKKYIEEYQAVEEGYNQLDRASGGRPKRRVYPGPLPEEHRQKIAASVRASWDLRRNNAVAV